MMSTDTSMFAPGAAAQASSQDLLMSPSSAASTVAATAKTHGAVTTTTVSIGASTTVFTNSPLIPGATLGTPVPVTLDTPVIHRAFLFEDDRIDAALLTGQQLLIGNELGSVHLQLQAAWEFLEEDGSLRKPDPTVPPHPYYGSSEERARTLKFLADSLRGDIHGLERLVGIINQAIQLQNHRLQQLVIAKLKE